MQGESRVYQIYYSKDIRKKKKVYSDGIMLCEEKKTKIFTSEGELVLSVNNKNKPEPDEEYVINNSYVVLIDREVPLASYVSGKIFMENKVAAPILPGIKKNDKAKKSLYKTEIDVAKEFSNGLKIETFLYDSLRPHQIQGVNFMFECITGQRGKQIQGCILADFMGLGKTLQTLALIRSVVIQKVASKVVVVCPLTLLRVWEKECLKWMGNKLSPLIAIGNGQEVSKTIRMFTDYDYRFLVVSYQNFLKNADALNKKCELLIFDEGHRLKNKKSKLFKKIQTFKCKKRILLTGTPLQNNLDQLYTCIALVNPSFFDSQIVFKNVFQKPILAGMAKNSTKQQRTLAVSRTLQLAGRIKQFSLRRKADVLQKYLPRKREYQIFFKLSPLQHQVYDRILKQRVSDADVLSFINMMRKLFTHPILFKTDRFQNNLLKDCIEDCRQQKSCKIEFIRHVASNCKRQNEKLVIVSYFTQTLDFVGCILEQEGHTIAKLDGRVDGQNRFKVVESFIREKDILLLSGKAGGTGLTLTCACKMIMIEPDWNPSNDSQVMGRVWRQGQQKEVQIYRLMIASSFQEKILQRQQLKQSLSQKLIDEQNNTASYDFFSLRQLFMEIKDHCLTYPQSSNKVNECQQKINAVDWGNVIHVHINQSHEQNLKIENQFEQALFEEKSESQSSADQEADLDAVDEDYYFDAEEAKKQAKIPEKQAPSNNKKIIVRAPKGTVLIKPMPKIVEDSQEDVIDTRSTIIEPSSNSPEQSAHLKRDNQQQNAEPSKLEQGNEKLTTSIENNDPIQKKYEETINSQTLKEYPYFVSETIPIQNNLPKILRKFKKTLKTIDPID